MVPRARRSGRLLCGAVLGAWLALAPVSAGPPAARPDDAGEVPGAWQKAMATRAGRTQVGAAAAAGLACGQAPRALAGLAVLRAGDNAGCWELVNTNEVRPFPEAWAEWVKDGRPIGVDDLETNAYGKTLALAHWTAAAALDRAARDDLTYRQFFERPEKYRGQVVRVTGRLKRVTRDDEPPEAAREAGVKSVYEGWLFSDALGVNPLCLVCTELPDGLEVRQSMEERVTFAGYFFKKRRYKAADTRKENEWREAPLLVGRFVAVHPRAPSPDDDTAWGKSLLWAFVGLVGATVAVVAALTWWFRRDDRRVRRRLAALTPGPAEPDFGDQAG